MKHASCTAWLGALMLVTGLSGCAGQRTALAERPSAQQWQMQRLFNPTPADLETEARGRVMIYDGLTDRVVSRAMREQFDRVDAMMFTRTIVTDATGEPRTDTDSGEFLREDDGC
ncbi:MAG: hypothetical protein PVI91_11820 [Gammaproteobacteria bacterium]|jgi:hypothetical protein